MINDSDILKAKFKSASYQPLLNNLMKKQFPEIALRMKVKIFKKFPLLFQHFYHLTQLLYTSEQ